MSRRGWSGRGGFEGAWTAFGDDVDVDGATNGKRTVFSTWLHRCYIAATCIANVELFISLMYFRQSSQAGCWYIGQKHIPFWLGRLLASTLSSSFHCNSVFFVFVIWPVSSIGQNRAEGYIWWEVSADRWINYGSKEGNRIGWRNNYFT